MGTEVRLAITPGEPAGIGPDLLVTVAQRSRRSRWVVFADSELLERSARRLGLTIHIDQNFDTPSTDPATLSVRHIPLEEPESPGRLNVNNAPYVLETLRAASDASTAGLFDEIGRASCRERV